MQRSSAASRTIVVRCVIILLFVCLVITEFNVKTSMAQGKVSKIVDNSGNTNFHYVQVEGPCHNTSEGHKSGLAQKMADAFCKWKKGPKSTSTVLQSDEATKQKVQDAINKAKDAAAPDDEFVLYWHCHGSDDWIVDVNKDEPNGFDNCLWLANNATATDDELTQWLSGFNRSVTITVILDTCYSGTFCDGTKDLPAITAKDGKPLDKGHLEVLMSAKKESPCGEFTEKILKGLEDDGTGHPKADANKDGIVTSKEAYEHAKSEITQYYELDNDGDGKLNEDGVEYNATAPWKILRIDNDGDGLIDEDPAPWETAYFESIDPMSWLIIDTFLGCSPTTLDPANCHDSASAELLSNIYETLITFDGEKYDYFIPQLAEQVWVAPPHPTAPSYTNCTVYFKIRPNVSYHNSCRYDCPIYPWSQYYLSTEDVEHSFERLMVYDYVGGPAGMIYEPLLSCYGANPSDPTFGDKIDDAVQRNATHVWLNIANKDLTIGVPTDFTPVPLFDLDGHQRSTFWSETAALPLDYPMRMLFSVISQPCASIMCKEWLINYVDPLARIAVAGHPGEWPGIWSTWTAYHNPTVGQKPAVDIVPANVTNTGVECGTGPYILQRLDYGNHWTAEKYDDYWGGWPALWPNPPYPPSPSANIKPKGCVDRITVRGRCAPNKAIINELQYGECDLATIPRYQVSTLHVGGNVFSNTLPGIRLNYPIFTLAVESFHMTFYIDLTADNRYGRIYANDTLSEDGVPANFFANIHVRKAFAYLINFTSIIADWLLGEAYQPNTFAPSGLTYVNLTIPKYSIDLAKAKTEFDQANYGGSFLKNTGFAINISYNDGNPIEQAICENLTDLINYIGDAFYGGKFHASALGVESGEYTTAVDAHQLPTFLTSFLPYSADIHSYAFAYAHSQGKLARAQRYSNPTTDALIVGGIRTPDGPARAQVYSDIEKIFYDDVPAVPLFVAVERGCMRDWVQGLYYNPLYPGIYAYNLWKWPMTATIDTEGYFVGDVTLDGRVSMDDIIAVVDAFGSYYGKLGMPIMHPRWNFRCDVDDSPRYRWRDRKIDMGDIVGTVANFGRTSQAWVPPP